MNRWIGPLAGFAVGAALMYLLDPQQGAGRRERLMGRRRAYSPLRRAAEQDDAELRQRVHERLGELVSQPHALDVRVENGVVRLSGNVLAQERDGLLAQVVRVPGVYRVVNKLRAREAPVGVVS